MKWLIENPAAVALLRRVALIGLGALLAHAAELSGVSPEDRAALREAMCSELFWSNPQLAPLLARPPGP